MTASWPRRGRCGACASPACAFPSREWVHLGRPCRARTQSIWGVHDAAVVRDVLRFVPDGQPLPAPSGWAAESVDRWRAWARYETEGGAA